MLRLIRSRLTLAKIAIVGALFLALGGVAYAAGGGFVGQHGNINGCISRNGGEVNFWKPGHRCTGGRINIAFPTRGAQGSPGAPGAAGATGATGATGPTGPANPSATTVDGETVSKLSLKVPTPTSGSSAVTLYSGDGLTVTALCDNSGNASLQASGPASSDSDLTVSGYQHGGSGAFGSQTATLGTTPVALGPASAGDTSFSYENTAGQIVTGQIGYQSAPSLGSYAGCDFFGTATSG